MLTTNRQTTCYPSDRVYDVLGSGSGTFNTALECWAALSQWCHNAACDCSLEGFIMFEIEKVFERVAELKYPDGQLDSLRTAFMCELYVTFGRAIETDMLSERSIEDVVRYCASLKLAGAGGTDWTRDQADCAVSELIDGLCTAAV